MEQKKSVALVFIGQLSPAFMAVADSLQKTDSIELIFLEISTKKSKIPSGFLSLHKTIDGKEATLENELEGIAKSFLAVYGLAVSYNYSAMLQSVSQCLPHLTVMSPSLASIQIMQSKVSMNEAALSAGLPVLNTLSFEQAMRSFPGQIVIRPALEKGAKFKAELILNKGQLYEFSQQDIVAQRFIEGPNLVVHVYTINEDYRYTYFIAKNKFEGVALTLENLDDGQSYTNMEKSLSKFLICIGFKGVGHFEFIFDKLDKKMYFLDFNGRMGGTTLKSYALGYNEIDRLLQQYELIDAASHITKKLIVVTNHIALFKYLVRALTLKKGLIDYPHENICRSILTFGKLLFSAKSELNALDGRLTSAYYKVIFIEKIRLAKKKIIKFLKMFLGKWSLFFIYRKNLIAPKKTQSLILGNNDLELRTTLLEKEKIRFSLVKKDREVCSIVMVWGNSYKKRNFIILAEDEAKIIGAETLHECRGKGHLGKLLLISEIEAKNHNINYLYGRIWHSNTSSIRGFKKAGWVLFGIKMSFQIFNYFPCNWYIKFPGFFKKL